MTATDWLLDFDSDPAIRWQAQRDLLKAAPNIVAAERAKVAHEGWGARLLALQAADGQWGGGTYDPKWISTINSLQLLFDFGVDPADEVVRSAVELVRERVVHDENPATPYFGGETEECVNGRVLAQGAYFGLADSDPLVALLLSQQLDDGGWNCDPPEESVRSSFHPTICVLEGLLEWENRWGASAEVTASRERAHEYLLERGLFRSKSSGEVINSRWTMFSYPTRWHYDVLRGLDYLRAASTEPDARAAEAIDLVLEKRDNDGRWPLEHFHAGPVHFDVDDGVGEPSRWTTLRALRVLDWYGR